jgi:hypothetical protein
MKASICMNLYENQIDYGDPISASSSSKKMREEIPNLANL